MSDLRRIYGRLSYEVRIGGAGARGRQSSFGDYRIGAYSVVHRTEALGYALVEDDRPGRFDPGAGAFSSACPPGRCSAQLQRGEAIQVNGATVSPEDVMGEPRPGRKLVFTGDTRGLRDDRRRRTRSRAAGTRRDVRARGAERARQTGHATALRGRRARREAGVSMLALTHLSSRYFGAVIEKEARAVFDRTVVPRDFDVIEIPYRERGEPALIKWRDSRERASPELTLGAE